MKSRFYNKISVERNSAAYAGMKREWLWLELDKRISDPMRLLKRIRDIHQFKLKHFIKNEVKKLKAKK